MNAIDLKGRIAIVTGGARGIGFAIAQRMLRSGAQVALWDIDAAAMHEAARPLQDSGVVYVRTVDVTDESSVTAATALHMRTLGKVDILVNNAGITGGNAPLWELEPEVWRRVIDVNLIGPYLTCRAIVPHMIAAGYGRIVNIASIAGKEGNPNASHYSASKAGLIALDQVAGQGAGDHGRAGQLHHAGGRQDRNVRADEAGAYRLHAVENPDESLRRGRGNRRHGGVACLGGVLVFDRRGVRYFGRPGGLLSARLGLDPAGDGTLHADPFRAVSSAEEHFLDMEGVRGSIPLPPTSLRSKSAAKAAAPKRSEAG